MIPLDNSNVEYLKIFENKQTFERYHVPDCRDPYSNIDSIIKLTALKELSLIDSSIVNDDFLEKVFSNLKLTRLLLSHNEYFSEEAMKTIFKLSNLEVLEIESCKNITPKILQYFSQIPNIKELYLRFCNDFSYAALEHFSCRPIKVLNLMGSCITDKDLIILSKFNYLEDLTLLRCKQLQFSQELKYLTNVRRLDVSVNSLNNLALVNLSTIPNLKTLILQMCNQITDFSNLTHDKLEELNLSECEGVSDNLNLTGVPSLQKLDISQCQKITQKGLKSIAVQLPKLKNLNLWNCCHLFPPYRLTGKDLKEQIFNNHLELEIKI